MRVSSHQTGADEQRLFHLVESIVQEIHSALFPKNPHTWHEHLVKKLKLLVDGNATADQRLWWSIREFTDNDHKKAAEDVASGVGYLVLARQPGLQEFRGIYLGGLLGIDKRAQKVCRTLRVPRQRGAVNWMTDCIQAMEQEARKRGDDQRKVLALFDAWMDLRGHAATEDLYLGNRSVAGFPLYLPGREAQVGYFFISHPMPGLFYRDAQDDQLPKPLEDFCRTLVDIRERFEAGLAMAVDLGLFAEFAQASSPATSASSRAADHLIDLFEKDPAGHVATLRLTSGVSRPDFAINEGAFTRQLWSHAALLSFFPREWQELTSSMEGFPPGAFGHSQCASPFWDPQETDGSWHSIHQRYYPSDVDSPYMAASKRSAIATHNLLRKRISIFKRLYSSSHDPDTARCPQADLVIPLGIGPERTDAPSRIAGFLRINCDSADQSRDEPYRQLYQIVADEHVKQLNDSLGTLLVLADDDLRLLNQQKNPGVFKQTYDAMRQLADWTTQRLARPWTKNDTDSLGDSLLISVLGSAWARIGEFDKNPRDLGNNAAIERRVELLKQAILAVHSLAKTLSERTTVPYTLVTFWLQIWTPTVDTISGDRDDFAELVLNDPGLMDVLQHLMLTNGAINNRNLCRTADREICVGGRVLDLGYPHRDAALECIEVTREEGDPHTTIRWKAKPSNHVHSVSLEWSSSAQAIPARLIPAALAYVPGRVSTRIAQNIASKGPITLTPTSQDVAEKVSLSDHLKNSEGKPPQFVMDLEELFVDQPAKNGSWTVLPLKRTEQEEIALGHLCILAPNQHGEEARSIVTAARSLSHQRALAQFRAKAMESEKSLAAHQGAIAHGFRGSAGRVKVSMDTMIDMFRKDSEPKANILEGMEGVRRQLSGLGALAEDALHFAKSIHATPTATDLTLTELLEDVEQVLMAMEQPFDKAIKVSQALTRDYPALKPRYDRQLFRHALARLLENALNEAAARRVKMFLSFQQMNHTILVQVFNAREHQDDSTLSTIRDAIQGQIVSSSGLFEANVSCTRSGLTLSADQFASDGHHWIELTIQIPTQQ